MDVRLRAYQTEDFDFARRLYLETMRWVIERFFGWDQAHQEASFADWFKPDEISIIIADGVDVGWIQQRLDPCAIFLGSIYIHLLCRGKASRQRREAVTLAVMKINPALALYERLGFRITHEDEHKFYMRADPT